MPITIISRTRISVPQTMTSQYSDTHNFDISVLPCPELRSQYLIVRTSQYTDNCSDITVYTLTTRTPSFQLLWHPEIWHLETLRNIFIGLWKPFFHFFFFHHELCMPIIKDFSVIRVTVRSTWKRADAMLIYHYSTVKVLVCLSTCCQITELLGCYAASE